MRRAPGVNPGVSEQKKLLHSAEEPALTDPKGVECAVITPSRCVAHPSPAVREFGASAIATAPKGRNDDSPGRKPGVSEQEKLFRSAEGRRAAKA